MAEETRQNFFKEKYLPTLGDKGAESLDALYNKAVAGAECNTVIELKPEHQLCSPYR